MNNAFSMQDDVMNGELSLEELEAIAAGWPHWMHSVANFVTKEVKAGVNWLEHSSTGQQVLHAAEGAAAKYLWSLL